MVKLSFKAKSFKKMEDPVDRMKDMVKYVFYAQANTIPYELNDWMETNPREQKMSTNVAKEIQDSLRENINFHELNRGVVISAVSVHFDNQSGIVEIQLDNPQIHGNIDGGHTLRAIFESNQKQITADERYVFFEVFTGVESPVELAAARNTSVQVDLKSIEELKKSFDVIKSTLEPLPFSKRIAYKMNEHYNDAETNPIDIREVLAIISMFSQTLYPYLNADGSLSAQQPIQCYTGKEATLRKFVNLKKDAREEMIMNMEGLFSQIFDLWEKIETNFSEYSLKVNKKYTGRKYSKFQEREIVSQSLFCEKPLNYVVPRGLIYPIVSAFRALVKIDPDTKKYYFDKDPILFADLIGPKLVGIVLDEKGENPDVIGKNANLWSNLFKEIFIARFL